MKAQLRHYLQHIKPLTPRELGIILDRFTTRIIKRDTVLISEGETCKELYFIKRGSIRSYYLNIKGEQKTRHIGTEDSLISSVSSFISRKPSTEYLETLEDTELYVISNQSFFELVNTIPAWAQFYCKWLESAYLIQNQKIADLITLTAKQRYEKLWVEKPQYFQKFTNKILASYLDIRPETLSRLKGK